MGGENLGAGAEPRGAAARGGPSHGPRGRRRHSARCPEQVSGLSAVWGHGAPRAARGDPGAPAGGGARGPGGAARGA